MRIADATLVDHMPEVATHSECPKARSFAWAMMRKSVRPGWKPTKRQAGYMRALIARLDEADDEPLIYFIDGDEDEHTGNAGQIGRDAA